MGKDKKYLKLGSVVEHMPGEYIQVYEDGFRGSCFQCVYCVTAGTSHDECNSPYACIDYDRKDNTSVHFEKITKNQAIIFLLTR